MKSKADPVKKKKKNLIFCDILLSLCRDTAAENPVPFDLLQGTVASMNLRPCIGLSQDLDGLNRLSLFWRSR